ncbi:MAG: hypothetical protein QXU98_05730 [Candidatus Parvarchaeota archaeon]
MEMFLYNHHLYFFDGHRGGRKQYIEFNGAGKNFSCQEYRSKAYQEISRVLSNGEVFIGKAGVKYFAGTRGCNDSKAIEEWAYSLPSVVSKHIGGG